jgi:ABC-type cobalamin transport system ATPase subunit
MEVTDMTTLMSLDKLLTAVCQAHTDAIISGHQEDAMIASIQRDALLEKRFALITRELTE